MRSISFQWQGYYRFRCLACASCRHLSRSPHRAFTAHSLQLMRWALNIGSDDDYWISSSHSQQTPATKESCWNAPPFPPRASAGRRRYHRCIHGRWEDIGKIFRVEKSRYIHTCWGSSFSRQIYATCRSNSTWTRAWEEADNQAILFCSTLVTWKMHIVRSLEKVV